MSSELVAIVEVIDASKAVRLDLETAVAGAADLQCGLDHEVAGAARRDRVTFQALRRAGGREAFEADADLAALVRSASRFGLRQCIAEFRRRDIGEQWRAGAI